MTLEELVYGVGRLKGAARSLDVEAHLRTTVLLLCHFSAIPFLPEYGHVFNSCVPRQAFMLEELHDLKALLLQKGADHL